MMAFKIGRKAPGAWENMTPPIRGGIYKPFAEPSPLGVETLQAKELDHTSNTTSQRHNSHHATDHKCDILEQSIEIRPDISSSNPFASHIRPGIAAQTVDKEPPSLVLSLPIETIDDTVGVECLGTCLTEEQEEPNLSSEYIDSVVRQGLRQDLKAYPNLDTAVQKRIVSRYRLLHKQVQEEGLYRCRFSEYLKDIIRYIALFALFIYTLQSGWYKSSAIFLGLFWHQIMFTAHDAGHCAITHIFVIDTLMAIFIGNFCCGLSIGWWKSSHNIHHLVTNHPAHDPDIQNVPLFATCPSFFKSLRSSYYNFSYIWDAVADVMVPYQKYTYYPIMAVARFNLYILSWCHLLSSRSSSLGGSKAWWTRPTEIAFMSGYWYLYGYCLLWRTIPTWFDCVAFVLISHIVTSPLHVQITLSHWGMSTSDLGEAESFPQRQLRTTMDIECPAWLDFIHGGLQFQAVHHLFPRVPRHNLRRAQTLIKQFSKNAGIPYQILGFIEGNGKVISRLAEVGEQAKILAKCQKYMAETGESGLH